MKIFTVDDLCLYYLENFELFDSIKRRVPEFRLIAFTISNYNNSESLKDSEEFKNWFEKHKEWVEIAVHSFDHMYPPDGDRFDEEKWIGEARDNLKMFLSEKYGYRSPGWQTTNKTVPILKRLGFSWIAYESHISYFNGGVSVPVVNSHLFDKFSIKRLEEALWQERII